jgi:transposase-like protein
LIIDMMNGNPKMIFKCNYEILDQKVDDLKIVYTDERRSYEFLNVFKETNSPHSILGELQQSWCSVFEHKKGINKSIRYLLKEILDLKESEIDLIFDYTQLIQLIVTNKNLSIQYVNDLITNFILEKICKNQLLIDESNNPKSIKNLLVALIIIK